MPRAASTRNTTPPITLPAIVAALGLEDAAATVLDLVEGAAVGVVSEVRLGECVLGGVEAPLY